MTSHPMSAAARASLHVDENASAHTIDEPGSSLDTLIESYKVADGEWLAAYEMARDAEERALALTPSRPADQGDTPGLARWRQQRDAIEAGLNVQGLDKSALGVRERADEILAGIVAFPCVDFADASKKLEFLIVQFDDGRDQLLDAAAFRALAADLRRLVGRSPD